MEPNTEKNQQAEAQETAQETAKTAEATAEETTATESAEQPETAAAEAESTTEEDQHMKKKELKAALEKAEAALADHKDQHLRLMAEYQNYRNRTTEEKSYLKHMTYAESNIQPKKRKRFMAMRKQIASSPC